MAVAIQNLNGDASFLLTFEPVDDGGGGSSSFGTPRPFRILLDPYITEASGCVSSLLGLPEPDVIIISQHRTQHCNEATLRQLLAADTKIIILANSSSARTIRSWKHFKKGRIYTIPEWETPHAGGRETVLRIGVPPLPLGEPGEITVSLIPQKHSFFGLHSAIGITYRSPLAPRTRSIRSPSSTILRPRGSHGHLKNTYITAPMTCQITTTTTTDLMPPTPRTIATTSHRSLRSVRSALSLKTSTAKGFPAHPSHGRPLSIIFSPHGIDYSSLHSYVINHLISEAALPLTALIHCFDSLEQPWWLGGNVLLGAPAGAVIATRLGARAWINAHGPDTTSTTATSTPNLSSSKKKFSKRTRRRAEDVVDHLKTIKGGKGGGAGINDTKVLALAAGEEVVLTSEAVYRDPESLFQGGIVGSPPVTSSLLPPSPPHPAPPPPPPLRPPRTRPTHPSQSLDLGVGVLPIQPQQRTKTRLEEEEGGGGKGEGGGGGGRRRHDISRHTTTTSFANLEEVIFRDTLQTKK